MNTSTYYNTTNKMKKPTSTTTEILLTLIRKRKVSIMDFPYLAGFRTRISELNNKYGITLKKENITDLNKYNQPYTYSLHKLPETQRNKAIRLYDKLIQAK